MIHLDYRDARPIYTQITDGIREQILSGILCEGDKLPSVRDLATQLTINPNTIQRAYRELENQGYLVTLPGKGTFVAENQSIREQRLAQLWKQLDQAVEELRFAGVTREELVERLQKGAAE